MTTRNTHEWMVAEVRDAAITNEHPIPLRVRDMLTAFADLLERRMDGVSDAVVELACRKYYNSGQPVYPPVFEAMRAALLAVWPVAAEPDDQSWDDNAERLTREAGIGGGSINLHATSTDDIFLPPAEPAQPAAPQSGEPKP